MTRLSTRITPATCSISASSRAVPAAGASVTVPAGTTLLLDVSPPPLGALTVDGQELGYDAAVLEPAAEEVLHLREPLDGVRNAVAAAMLVDQPVDEVRHPLPEGDVRHGSALPSRGDGGQRVEHGRPGDDAEQPAVVVHDPERHRAAADQVDELDQRAVRRDRGEVGDQLPRAECRPPLLHRAGQEIVAGHPAEITFRTPERDLPLPAGAEVSHDGGITVLRVADLQFTDQEAAELLNTSMGLQLGAEDLERLVAAIEGIGRAEA